MQRMEHLMSYSLNIISMKSLRVLPVRHPSYRAVIKWQMLAATGDPLETEPAPLSALVRKFGDVLR